MFLKALIQGFEPKFRIRRKYEGKYFSQGKAYTSAFSINEKMLENFKYVNFVTKFTLLDRSISSKIGSFSLINELWVGYKSETECPFTVYQLSSMHEIAVLRHEIIRDVCGIDLTYNEILKKLAKAARKTLLQGYKELCLIYSWTKLPNFISPEFAEVLFTADTVTASTVVMTGNFVKGVGEALVSGESRDDSFKLKAVKYEYEGFNKFRSYAKNIWLREKIVGIFDCPQDIKWAVCGGKIYILQTHPITKIYHRLPILSICCYPVLTFFLKYVILVEIVKNYRQND